MKLSAELPVAAGIIVVRPTPDGSVVWAAGSTTMSTAASGTATTEIEAHLAALEAFLDHPDHADRRLTIDVEDTLAGHSLVEFAAKHLPRIPVTAHPDVRAHGDRASPGTWEVLAALLEPPAEETPAELVHIEGGTGSSRVMGQPAAGWAWVTSDGRWRTGTIRNRKVVAVEVISLLRLISTFPNADSFHIRCSSRPALAVIHQVRHGGLGVNTAMADLSLQHDRYQRMFETVLRHQADIQFKWVPDNPGHLLTQTADRLAVQARRALQSKMPNETFAVIQENILADLHACLGTSPRDESTDGR